MAHLPDLGHRVDGHFGVAHDLAGDTFLIIDEHGAAGYLAGQDLVIELTGGVNLASLSLSNFETAA